MYNDLQKNEIIERFDRPVYFENKNINLKKDELVLMNEMTILFVNIIDDIKEFKRIKGLS